MMLSVFITQDAMLFCDACDKGYHMDCHNPPVEEKPTGKGQFTLSDNVNAAMSLAILI